MAVCIDQSGHQGLAADVDDVPADRRTRRSAYLDDTVSLDDHDRLVEVLAPHAVEDSRIHECGSIHELPEICFRPSDGSILHLSMKSSL